MCYITAVGIYTISFTQHFAHELGHNLGMIHQGITAARGNNGNDCHRNQNNAKKGCTSCDGFGPGKECCTGYMDYTTSRTAWSPCSVANFENMYKSRAAFAKTLVKDAGTGKLPACKKVRSIH